MFSLDWFLFLQRSLSNVVNDGVKLEDTNSVERRQENCQSLFEVQRIKDLVLSLQQLQLLFWCGFDPWPGNCGKPWVWHKKKSEIPTLALKNWDTGFKGIMEGRNVPVT